MKAYILLLMAVLTLFVFSCKSTTKTDEGYLIVRNHTTGNATVHIGNGNSFTIQPNSSYTKTINTEHSTSFSIYYTGDYIDSGNDNITVTTDHTSTYDLYADCARLKIYNNSDGELRISFANKASVYLDANSYDTYKMYLPNGESGTVRFDYEGLYVLSDYRSFTLYSDELTATNINADAGAINIINDSSYTIYHLYLSPSSQSSWGPDLLDVNLYSGNSALWTVAPGHWDIKLINDFGDAVFIYDEFISTNHTLNVTFLDRNELIWQKLDKKQSGDGDFKQAVPFIAVNQ